MTDIVMSWPWYDRLAFGAFSTAILFGPYYIVQRLDRVITLLEQILSSRR